MSFNEQQRSLMIIDLKMKFYMTGNHLSICYCFILQYQVQAVGIDMWGELFAWTTCVGFVLKALSVNICSKLCCVISQLASIIAFLWDLTFLFYFVSDLFAVSILQETTGFKSFDHFVTLFCCFNIDQSFSAGAPLIFI